jgi:hypothetical protein
MPAYVIGARAARRQDIVASRGELELEVVPQGRAELVGRREHALVSEAAAVIDPQPVVEQRIARYVRRNGTVHSSARTSNQFTNT